jgi:hypothetical protein
LSLQGFSARLKDGFRKNIQLLLFAFVLIASLNYSPTAKVVPILFLGFMAITFVLVALILTAATLKDIIKTRRLPIEENMSQKDIYCAILSLSTKWGRFLYVQKIKKARVKAFGDWPKGHAPNNGDTASTLLAQLDENWLGLDR